MKETFKCFITISSPLHIGCDEVYEPTSFVVEQETHTLIQFQPSEFISNLEPVEQEKLSRICRKGTVSSILELYKFFQGRKAEGSSVDLCKGFIDHYRKTLQLPEKNDFRITKELNNFKIERTAFRLSDNRPYLPGSSIKGALRTGYLNSVCQGRKQELPYDRSNKPHKVLEQQLLNYRQIDEDPFGKVKVSDFQPVGDVKTRIVYAVNKKKKLSDREAGGPYQILEVIQPGSVFMGEITVDDVHLQSKINNPVVLDFLISGAGSFYDRENRREKQELSGIGLSGVDLLKEKSNARVIPLRLGRHSGAESVTIEGNRSIKIMRGRGNRPETKDHATTFWLASPESRPSNTADLFPFGWTGVELLSPENENLFAAEEQAYLDQVLKQAEEKMLMAEQRVKEKLEALKKAEALKAELERQKQEEEKRKKALESMCPEERFIFHLDEETVSEEEVNVRFKNLDDCPEALKKEVALRLKKYWQNNEKWTKKQVGKQWKKVRVRNDIIEKLITGL